MEGTSIHTGSMSDLIVINDDKIHIQEQPRMTQDGRILKSHVFLRKPNTIGKFSG